MAVTAYFLNLKEKYPLFHRKLNEYNDYAQINGTNAQPAVTFAVN